MSIAQAVRSCWLEVAEGGGGGGGGAQHPGCQHLPKHSQRSIRIRPFALRCTMLLLCSVLPTRSTLQLGTHLK